MKHIVYLILAIAVGGYVNAQDVCDWKASFRIVDETGVPIKNAAVTVFYNPMALPGNAIDPGKIAGLTDANGAFTASHRDRTYGLRFLVEKNGYYPIDIQDDFHGRSSKRFADKFNPNLNIVLKKIGKPIPMYAKQINGLKFPEFNKVIGYDLMAGDWVAPYGKGVNSDILLTENHADAKSGYVLTVTFPNSGDGIQEFTVADAEMGSALRSPHEAPVDGYQSEMAQTAATNPNRNFFFRVRTILDEKGNVKSALYGKIYGDLAQFSYYLNPTSNDRNIEFDPNMNLLGGIHSFEQVTAP